MSSTWTSTTTTNNNDNILSRQVQIHLVEPVKLHVTAGHNMDTHKHGQVLRVSDGSFHHGHHMLMGNHLLTRDTDMLHTAHRVRYSLRVRR